MQPFQELSYQFDQYLKQHLPFPSNQESLYEPCRYLIDAGGKRVRPVLCLMAADMFGTINKDAFNAAMAIELFHNFTLIHDDIMDKSPLRRGKPTVHIKYGLTSGILSGDVMGIYAYNCLGQISVQYLPEIIQTFNKTAIEVCEGQQWDMDFETIAHVQIDDYLKMISLKTSVLLAVSLQMGAIVAGAKPADAKAIYEFGKNLGIAFQLQDDYLDTFGEETKIGKKPGGDIRSNKKTYLMLQLQQVLKEQQQMEKLEKAQAIENEAEKVDVIKDLYLQNSIDKEAQKIVNQYFDEAIGQLNAIALPEERKTALYNLANWLLVRQN